MKDITISGSKYNYYVASIANSTYDNTIINIVSTNIVMENINTNGTYLYGIANTTCSYSTIALTSSSLTMKNITSNYTYGIANTTGYNLGYSDILLSNTTIDIEDIDSEYFYGTINISYPDSSLTLYQSNITMTNISANTINCGDSYAELIESNIQCP